ncbi:hypothetical protein NQZ68_002146 [Dissostichus eleginoides]|nr:hypothetical protein NQZ68_002146 [Dissostichus eleginoides]
MQPLNAIGRLFSDFCRSPSKNKHLSHLSVPAMRAPDKATVAVLQHHVNARERREGERRGID